MLKNLEDLRNMVNRYTFLLIKEKKIFLQEYKRKTYDISMALI